MAYVGWESVVNQANNATGAASNVSADVSGTLSTGLGVSGEGVVNQYLGAIPPPPEVLGYILLESVFQDYLLQETGTPPTRIQLE